MRLAGAALGAVDRLPPGVENRLDPSLGEQRLECSVPARRQLAGAGVLEQELDSLGRVLLVGADDAARAALDPAGRVQAGLDPAALVRNRPGALVERDAGQPHAPVADAAEDDPARDRLALVGRDRASVDELVAHEFDRLDRALAEDRDR